MTRTIRSFSALAVLGLAMQACSVTMPALVSTGQAGKEATPAVKPARPSGGVAEPAGNVTTAPNPAVVGAGVNAAASGDLALPAGGGNAGGSVAADPQVALKAGAIDDNAKFEDYLGYMQGYAGPRMLGYDVSERHVIVVKDASGLPAANRRVTVSAGDQVVFTGKTYANGQLLFFPKAVAGSDVGSRYFVTVGDDTDHAMGFDRAHEGPWEIALAGTPELAAAKRAAPALDLQIVIDTTGSMGGEIAQLQHTIQSIASRIQALPQAPTVRFGLVAFKDQQGSSYLTKKTDFTSSVEDFGQALNALSASGGGDTPEDDESAIAEALDQPWSAEAPLHLSFLITDAPPHLDYPQDVPYTDSIAKAQAQGVKFFTVGASGLPADGEFFLRQLAEATMGQYVFITRGGDEFTGGGEVSATVDSFKEGRLDDVMVNVVKHELDALSGQ